MREYSRGLVLENSENFPEELMRELIPSYVDKESRALKEEGVQGPWEEEKGGWGFGGGEKHKPFSPSLLCLSQYNNVSGSRTCFSLTRTFWLILLFF